MPHIGFADQLNDRIVIRGGYGATSFYEGNSFNQRLTAITPFLQAAGFYSERSNHHIGTHA